MLPNLSLLSLETNVKLAKPEKSGENDQLTKVIEKYKRENFMRKLALEILSKKPALPSVLGLDFSSINPDHKSIVALILYTKGWDQHINNYLKHSFEGLMSRDMSWSNNRQMTWEYARTAITMFMNREYFYDKFVLPYYNDKSKTFWYFSKDGDYAYFKATLTDTCVFGDLEIIPPFDDKDWLHSYIQKEMHRLGFYFIRKLNMAIKDDDNDESTVLMFDAFENMIESINSLFRPWFYFYAKNKLQNHRNEYLSDCAAVGTGNVLWFGLDKTMDLHTLSTTYRSSSLSIKVASNFSRSTLPPVIFGLLLDANVPVISVLEVLGQSPQGVCFPEECEFLISHGCIYEFVAETKEEQKSFDAQMNIIKDTYPEQHKSITSSSVVEEMKGHSVLTFLRVKFDQNDLSSGFGGAVTPF